MVNSSRIQKLDLSTEAQQLLAALVEQANYNKVKGFYKAYYRNFTNLSLADAVTDLGFSFGQGVTATEELVQNYYIRRESPIEVTIDQDFLLDQIKFAWHAEIKSKASQQVPA